MNPIHCMHHSQIFDYELESTDVPRERSADKLYREMINELGRDKADEIAFSCQGMNYQQVCDTFITALSDADLRTTTQGD